MSRVTELAKDEADRVESEETVEPDADAVAVDPEPEPAPAPAEFDLETGVRKLEQENTRHAKRVAEIMGADAEQLIPCPTCVVGPVGFVFELPESTPEFKQAPDAERCEDCNGLGDVLTGAVVERGKFKACPSCSGNGWRGKLAPVPNQPQQPQPAPVDPAALEQLRAAGYTVVEPYVPPVAVPA